MDVVLFLTFGWKRVIVGLSYCGVGWSSSETIASSDSTSTVQRWPYESTIYHNLQLYSSRVRN